MYNIIFEETAVNDLKSIFDYISKNLLNEQASKKLSNKIKQEIISLKNHPLSNPIFQSKKVRKHQYRILIVNNFIVFYWINDNENRIIIARVLYSKRDFDDLLN